MIYFLCYLSLFFTSLFASPLLQIDTSNACIGSEMTCIVAGLEPHQLATIRASTRDQNEVEWKSWALFSANKEGVIDVRLTKPLAGTYEQADPMGLVWSMEPQQENASLFHRPKEKLHLDFTVEVLEGVVCSKQVTLLDCPTCVQRIEVREEGLVGTLFLPPSQNPLPAVLCLNGQGGGLCEARAKLLASHGYVSFALAYFRKENLPPRLESIPIEYFEKAIDFLTSHPAVNKDKIALLGYSRGGELSLLLGSLFPERFSAIATHVGSGILWGAFPNQQLPAWTWQGKAILPAFPLIPVVPVAEGYSPQCPASATPSFLHSLRENPHQIQQSSIPVENISCPLLLISGTDDGIWPSTFFANHVQNRIREHNSPIFCEHISYPGAGHLFSPPCSPTTRSTEFHADLFLWVQSGGEPEREAFARVDAWKRTLEFFKNALLTN